MVHRTFQPIKSTVARLALAGLVLGLPGVAGGLITLFKGLDESRELVANVGAYTTGGLLLILAVKAGALLVPAAGGFRGGRIFPRCSSA